jgi:hypothetical protein
MDEIQKYDLLTDQREQERETAGDALEMLFDALDTSLFALAARLIAGLDTDERGRIVFTVRNIAKIGSAALVLQAETTKANRSILSKIYNRFLRLFGLGTKYQAIFTDPRKVEKDIAAKVFELYGFKDSKQTPNGYIAEILRSNPAVRQIIDQMRKAVAGRVPLRQFQKEFADFFTNQNGGASKRYFARFSHDLYMEFDRTLSLEYATELGTDTHAIYAGVRVKDSREFCMDRLNQIYTRSVIDSWNNLEWQGKRPGDVKVVLGGYNCTHNLNWISADFAELWARERGVEIDSYR